MQLPIGFDDFREVLENDLDFIDKTLFIKDIFDDKEAKVIVITRPRRFGKTFNLSLLHYFLSPTVYGQPTQGLFEGLNITKAGDGYMHHQGKYPVISVTFKEIKENNYESAKEHLSKVLSVLYEQYQTLLESEKLSDENKKKFEKILSQNGSEIDLKSSLSDLTRYLYLHYGVKPWLLIDEYDSPIQASYVNKYYDKMIDLMRGLFGSSLKNNPYLHKAVITGILRIAKESLFSGVNNLEVYSLLREGYSQYFGFTEEEVNAVLRQSNLSEKASHIKKWYNGYQFGDTIIYNPWSIANCVKRKGETEPYWVNTSDNQLIKDLLKHAPLTFKSQFEALMQGDTTEQIIDENMVFADLKKSPNAVWSLLLMSGYLTAVSSESVRQGKRCQLRVPNQEVNNLYCNIIEMWLSNGHGPMWYSEFTQNLVSGNIAAFEADLKEVLLQIVSYHDLAKEPEAFFHGLLLGFIASLQETHEIKSNRESGLGRYDILIIPKDRTKLSVIIELKAKSKDDTTSLESLAEQALKQIDEKKYASELKSKKGAPPILKIAIAFQGKQFVLRYKAAAL